MRVFFLYPKITKLNKKLKKKGKIKMNKQDLKKIIKQFKSQIPTGYDIIIKKGEN
ncbi:hypothetical protein PAWBP_7720 [Paulownia witches'-broom phytoplasma]|nr:hypothetical protein PAWBP_7720 [Paulownia witches'-broom phytoplasma]